jgi:hypothetical protein
VDTIAANKEGYVAPKATKEQQLAWNEYDPDQVKKTWKSFIDHPVTKVVGAGLDLATGGIAGAALNLADRGFRYGVDYASGNKRDFSKKDKKALSRFGKKFAPLGKSLGGDIKNRWDNTDWGDSWFGNADEDQDWASVLHDNQHQTFYNKRDDHSESKRATEKLLTKERKRQLKDAMWEKTQERYNNSQKRKDAMWEKAQARLNNKRDNEPLFISGVPNPFRTRSADFYK